MGENLENKKVFLQPTKLNINAINERLVFHPSKLDDTHSYGWFSIRPLCLQRFSSPRWALFMLCWAAALQGLIVNGFVNVVITTIEKRYHLSSTESGLIVGAYDIAGLLFLIPVSYFGESRSKPKFIAYGVLLLALGSFIFGLPYLTSGPYIYTQQEESHLCISSSAASSNLTSSLTCQSKSSKSASNLSNYLYVFLFAMLLNGAGASPFYTLGCTYIDDNVSTSTASLYLGIYYTMAILGPAVGYILGGQLLQIYVDLSMDASKLSLTPSSNVWVGAWWIGFFVSAVICLVVIIPISGLPQKLPGSDEANAKKLVEMHKNIESSEAMRPGFGVKLKDLPVSLKILLKNGPFMLLSLAGSSDSLIVAGLAAFAPKITEQQFGLSASTASLLVGIVALSAAGGGNFLGSYLIKRFDMKYATIIKMCIIVSLISLVFTTSFIISCPDGLFAGLNTKYANESSFTPGDFTSTCNANCLCSNTQYDPICGEDNVLYYSPCYAACRQSNESNGITTYSQCDCIESQKSEDGISTNTQAERRRCPSNCRLLPLFLTLQFFLIFCTFLVSMPSLSATLRCVAKSQKSFALGVQWLMIRILGTIPAPIMFGKLIDLSCILWQTSCHNDSEGACLFYDNHLMSRYMLILIIICKFVTCFSIITSWILYKPPSGLNSVVPQEQIITYINNGGDHSLNQNQLKNYNNDNNCLKEVSNSTKL